MSHQAKTNEHNGASETATSALARDMREFADGLVTLAELQAQLFIAHLKHCGRRAFVPGLVLLCGVMLGLACFPIALAALALLLIEVFAISSAAGFLIAAVVGTVASVLMCAIGWFQVRERVAVLRRSHQEFVRNLDWIKKVLKRKRTTRTTLTTQTNGSDNSWRTVT